MAIVAACTLGRKDFTNTPPVASWHPSYGCRPTPFSLLHLLLPDFPSFVSLRRSPLPLPLLLRSAHHPPSPLTFPMRSTRSFRSLCLSLSCSAQPPFPISLPLPDTQSSLSCNNPPSRRAAVSPYPFPTRNSLSVDFPLHFPSPSLAEIDSALPSRPPAPLRRPFSTSFSLPDADAAVSLTQQPAFRDKLPHKLPIEASARRHPSFAAFQTSPSNRLEGEAFSLTLHRCCQPSTGFRTHSVEQPPSSSCRHRSSLHRPSPWLRLSTSRFQCQRLPPPSDPSTNA